jgi:predicted Zn finger-like uncharacterized protein
MALATRCPNCNALFRVAAEQLRSRGGMVRCGSCRRVFNAIAGLDYLDAERLSGEDSGPSRAAPPPAPDTGVTVQPTLAVAAPAGAQPGSVHALQAPTRPYAPAAPSTSARDVTPTTREAARDAVHDAMPGAVPGRERAPTPEFAPPPMERRRTPRPGAPARGSTDDARTEAQRAATEGYSLAEPSAESPAESGQGLSFDTLFVVPKSGTDEDGTQDAEVSAQDDAPDEPSFLRAPDETPSRGARAAFVAASALLVPLLLIQLTLIARTPLLVAFPALRPALQALCAPVGCAASWPMRPDLLAVVSSELQSVPGTDALEMDTVLRNRAAFPLALPAIELTISDSVGHAVERKVFMPADYLATTVDADPAAGNIAPGADLAVRVTFSLPGVSATGFEAYPFYP